MKQTDTELRGGNVNLREVFEGPKMSQSGDFLKQTHKHYQLF